MREGPHPSRGIAQPRLLQPRGGRDEQRAFGPAGAPKHGHS